MPAVGKKQTTLANRSEAGHALLNFQGRVQRPQPGGSNVIRRHAYIMPFSDAQIEEEQAHFANVIATFQQYAPYAVS